MKRILMSLMAIVLLVIGLVGAGTAAYFSDTATSAGNTFTAGTLDIGEEGLTDAAVITLDNMAPGDVSGPFVVVITNAGSLNLAWLGDWQFEGDPDLMDALYIASARMEFLAPDGSPSWLDDDTTGYGPGGGAATNDNGQDNFITNGTGSGPYSGWYTTLAGLSEFSVVTFNNWNDNAGMVPGSVYEHAGALKPNYSYRLTVTFGMAPGAGNVYQDLGPVTASLTVNATQINAAALELQGVPAASAPGLVTWMNAQIADQVELP